MIKVLMMIFTTLVFITTAWAAKTRLDEKTTSKKVVFEAQSIMGDKSVDFKLIEESGKWIMHMHSNQGDLSNRTLTKKDFDFIKEEFLKLPVAKSIPKECSRSQIKIKLSANGKEKEKTKISCLGVKTITEPAYARFTQILVNAL